MKMYGSYSDADLDHWQNLPMNSYVLTQSAFGAWLMRRDENKAKQFPAIPLDKIKQTREEIDELDGEFLTIYDGTNKLGSGKYVYIEAVLEILDKLIAESEEK